MTKVTCILYAVFYENDNNFEEVTFGNNEKDYAMYLILIESLKIINELRTRIDKMYYD